MTTDVIFADTTDGNVHSQNAVWATMQAGSSLTADTTSTTTAIGQASFGTPAGDQYFVAFNTSPVGTDTVSTAVLSLYIGGYNGLAARSAEARLDDWGTSVTTADWLTPTAFGNCTLLAHLSFNGLVTLAYSDFADDSMTAHINGSGSTRIVVSTDSFRNAATTNAQLQTVQTADAAGTTHDPKLTIVHTGTTSEAGPNSPGTVVDDNGVGSITWSNPSYAAADDTNYATAVSGACFIAGTEVILRAPNGDFYGRPIEQLRIGDTLLAYDRDATVAALHEPYLVLATVEELIEQTGIPFMVWTGERAVHVTAEHPFLTPDRGWVTVADLAVGDTVLTLEGPQVLLGKEPEPGPVTVYNLRASGPHTYFAEGFVVHNKPDTSHYLKATGFGFSIPDGATINGITVETLVSASVAATSDYRARIVKGGTIKTTDRADAGAWPTNSDFEYVVHGGTSDLWGESWAASDINDSGFGFALAATVPTGYNTAYVDYIRIRVVYTPSAGTNADAGNAAATGAAQTPNTAVEIDATGYGAATATANAPTAQHGMQSAAGLSSATAAASAPTLTLVSNAPNGYASATASAPTASRNIAPPAGLSSAAVSAPAPAASLNATAGTTAATASAPASAPSVMAYAGLASATASAPGPSVTTVVVTNVDAGYATATGAANAPASSVLGSGGIASATGTAQGPAPQIGPNAAAASATVSASAPALALTADPSVASATGAAYGSIPTGATNAYPGYATGAGVAQGVALTASASAGYATATGVAFDPTLSAVVVKNVDAGYATATGAAYGAVPTGTSNAYPGYAAATGVAGAPDRSLGPSAGYAQATASAPLPAAAPSVTAALATATGAAQVAAVLDAASAGLSSATGAAYGSVPTGSSNAYPGIATASGLASAPTLTLLAYAPAGLAEASAVALDPTLTITANVPIWTTPANAVSMNATPELRFTMPSMAAAMFFDLQLDTADTFDTVNLRNYDSSTDQTGWEYWDGGNWVAPPSDGVPAIYAGNEARLTVADALAGTTWYRRVRAGT